VLLFSLLLVKSDLFFCFRLGLFLENSAMPGWVLVFCLSQGSFVATGTCPAHQLGTVIPTVKSGFLLALVTCFGRSVSLVIGRTSLTLSPNKRCWKLAVLATCRFTILSNILLASLTNAAGFTLAFLLKLCSAVSTFHHGEVTATFLTELLALAELFKGMPGEALGAGVQLALLRTHGPDRLKSLVEE